MADTLRATKRVEKLTRQLEQAREELRAKASSCCIEAFFGERGEDHFRPAFEAAGSVSPRWRSSRRACGPA
jgi:hypothetical protein